MPFVLAYHASHETGAPARRRRSARSRRPRAGGGSWAKQCTYDGEWKDAVMRSLITLKALTYAPTGGIVAAPTTSLPEWIGSVRNWDYRFCWLRDATLHALVAHGRRLHRGGAGLARLAAARRGRRSRGPPDHVRRRAASGGSPSTRSTGSTATRARRPVRVGNAASEQFQLDVYGEVLATLLPHPQAHARRRRPPATRGRSSWRCSARSRTSGAARRGHLGGARPAPALHPLEGDGVARLRPRGAATSRSSGSTGPSSGGARSATRSTSRSAPRASTPSSARSPSPTGRSSSTPRCS